MLARAGSFILRNLKNPLYIIWYSFAFPQKIFKNNAHFLSDEELVEELRRGKSLIRLGDGEIYMLNHGAIPSYEPYNPKLRKDLLKIIKNYSASSPYIIGIPVFTNYSNDSLRKMGKLNVWLPLKILYRYIFPHNTSYFDAHIFYREGGFERSLAKIIDTYKVIIVTRKYNIDLMEEANVRSRFPVTYIETPNRETYAITPFLLKKIEELIGNDKDTYRVILAAGPASKVVAYELSKKGVTAYDVGKGIEAMYRPNDIEEMI